MLLIVLEGKKMKHSNNITYKNVLLRPLEEFDIEFLRQWRNNPSNNQYLNRIPYITPEVQKKWFYGYINNDDEMTFAIIENHELNRIVGSLSLYHFKTDECLFGKILIGDDEAHGRKIGLNATIAATRIAFEQLHLNRIMLYVYVDNFVAYNIYLKAGFKVVDEHIDESGQKEYTMIKENEGDKLCTI